MKKVDEDSEFSLLYPADTVQPARGNRCPVWDQFWAVDGPLERTTGAGFREQGLTGIVLRNGVTLRTY
jgi:hypothetical protein